MASLGIVGFSEPRALRHSFPALAPESSCCRSMSITREMILASAGRAHVKSKSESNATIIRKLTHLHLNEKEIESMVRVSETASEK